MNTTNDNNTSVSGDAVEALLEKAAPRPMPPEAVAQEVRAAVHGEWQTVTGRRRRRVAAGYALAATVTLVLAFSLIGLRQQGVAPVEVASIDRSIGTLYFQSNSSGVLERVHTNSIVTGQMLTTGKESAAGLDWHEGGSLRVDADTRVEFSGSNEVFLHTGRIYFDSAGAGDGSDLSIRTEHGVVTHVGTQFLTESTASSLIVSVREGEVSIDGAFHDQAVYRGQRAQLTGSARPVLTNTTGVGADWQWVEAVSPAISVDGMSVYDFLQWVGRETGHVVRFGSASAELLARTTLLKGSVNAGPRAELRLRMMTVDLDARFDGEGRAIFVTD